MASGIALSLVCLCLDLCILGTARPLHGWLPSHFQCHLLGRHQTKSEAGRVWRFLEGRYSARADITCCSFDKVKSILEYADLVLSFKKRTMDQQLEFANEIHEATGRSSGTNPCQPLMHGRFRARVEALKQVALPMGREGIELQRTAILLTLRLGSPKMFGERFGGVASQSFAKPDVLEEACYSLARVT